MEVQDELPLSALSSLNSWRVSMAAKRIPGPIKMVLISYYDIGSMISHMCMKSKVLSPLMIVYLSHQRKLLLILLQNALQVLLVKGKI